MAIDVKIIDPGGFELDIDVLAGFPADIPPRRVVPLRFARAVQGFSDASAPDQDDHGFTLCDGGSAHGPVVGIKRGPLLLGTVVPGPEARLKVMRDAIDPQAKLFPTVEDQSIAQIIFPTPGNPIDPVGTSDPTRGGDIIAFQATSTGNVIQDCKLFIHHGSVSGPVVAEMLIRVFPVLSVPVQAHIVTINGIAPSITLATVNRIFQRVNAVYAQAGVEFAVTQSLSADSFTGFERDGTLKIVREDPDETDLFFEPATVLGGFVRNQYNVYFVRHLQTGRFDDTAGDGVSRARALKLFKDPRLVGAIMRENVEIAMAIALAHETGHVLGLAHYGGGEPSTKDVREDIWAHRCLMYAADGVAAVSPVPGNKFQSSPARIEVGYGTVAGTRMVGQLLMTKNRAGIAQSNQTKVVRDGVQSGAFLAGTP